MRSGPSGASAMIFPVAGPLPRALAATSLQVSSVQRRACDGASPAEALRGYGADRRRAAEGEHLRVGATPAPGGHQPPAAPLRGPLPPPPAAARFARAHIGFFAMTR